MHQVLVGELIGESSDLIGILVGVLIYLVH